MNCEAFKARLDAYIDGELSESENCEMREHARVCADCGRELEAAEALRDVLPEIDEGIAVPLAAQAAWRSAIRKEAGAKSMKKRLRIVYAAAAAVAVLLGCTAALKGGSLKNQDSAPQVAPMMAAEIVELSEEAPVVVAADGMAKSVSAPEEAFTAWRKIVTEDMNAARETITALCAEYGAALVREDLADGSGIFVIELPYDYMEDFMNAAGEIGDVLDAETRESTPETAVVELQITEG